MEARTDFKQTAALAAAAAAASSGAVAADMPIKAPVAAPVPQTWQGIYVGGTVGASWLKSTQDDTAAVGSLYTIEPFFLSSSTTGGSAGVANSMGLLGGVNLGFNLQSGNFVYGLESSFSWLGAKAASSNGSFVNTTSGYGLIFPYSGTTSRSSKVSELSMLRARAGFDFNGTLPYLSVGLALGRIQNTFSIAGRGYNDFPVSASVSQTSWVPGIVLGGGVEHKLTQNLSIKADFAWIGFADKTLSNPLSNTGTGYLSSSGGPVKFSNELTLTEIGLNYRF